MSLLVGMFIGSLASTLVFAGTSITAPTIPTRPAVPPRLVALARRYGGRVRETTPHKAIPLPQRIPGAALVHNPSPYEGQLTHVAPMTWRRRIAQRFTTWFHGWLFESDANFQHWWERTARSERPVHGRHRRDEMLRSDAWRTRWASHPTQDWPTIATTSLADEVTSLATKAYENASHRGYAVV